MSLIIGVFERATIRGIVDYLLFGLGPDEDNRDYEDRLEEPYMKFEKAVAKYDKNPNSELLDLSNEVTSETASVYTEIGIQVGILHPHIIKSVPLWPDLDHRLKFFHVAVMINKRQLEMNTTVKVIEEVAPILENGVFILILS